jgi:hypothetical protein
LNRCQSASPKTIVKEYRFGIVGFVGKRDQQGLRRLCWQLSKVSFLARSPVRLRLGPRIRTIGDDLSHGNAESRPDVF